MTTRIRALAPAGIALALALAAAPAAAGPFHAAEDKTMGCFLRLEGPIADGDTERLRPHLERQRKVLSEHWTDSGQNPTRICLNSPGGSLAEAVRMARAIYGHWGTAVARGDRCESACAVLFMAGSRSPEDDRGVIADRVLHPLGRLGFHAPGLAVPQGQYREATVTRAYDVALKSVSMLIEIAGHINFPQTLLGAMIEVPPSGMMHVETVGEAARWRIGVAPTIEIDRLTPLAVLNACHNYNAYQTDNPSLSGFFSLTKPINNFDRPTIEQDADFVRAELVGFGQERASACRLTLEALAGPTAPAGYVGIGDEAGTEIYKAEFFSRDTPIAALALADDAQGVKAPLESRNAPWRRRLEGRCFVFRGEDALDSDPCVMERTQIARPDLYLTTTETFTWPSGARTVVVSEGPNGAQDKVAINGVGTELEYLGGQSEPVAATIRQAAAKLDDMDWTASCWLNPNSGNRFCFMGYEPMSLVPRWAGGVMSGGIVE